MPAPPPGPQGARRRCRFGASNLPRAPASFSRRAGNARARLLGALGLLALGRLDPRDARRLGALVARGDLVEEEPRLGAVAGALERGADLEQGVRHLVARLPLLDDFLVLDDGVLVAPLRVVGLAQPVLGLGRERIAGVLAEEVRQELAGARRLARIELLDRERVDPRLVGGVLGRVELLLALLQRGGGLGDLLVALGLLRLQLVLPVLQNLELAVELRHVVLRLLQIDRQVAPALPRGAVQGVHRLPQLLGLLLALGLETLLLGGVALALRPQAGLQRVDVAPHLLAVTRARPAPADGDRRSETEHLHVAHRSLRAEGCVPAAAECVKNMRKWSHAFERRSAPQPSLPTRRSFSLRRSLFSCRSRRSAAPRSAAGSQNAS